MSYTYTKVEDLEDKPVVGTRQCVALVQHYAGAPVSTAWRQGDAVVGNRSLSKGTAIATFVRGRYPNRSHGNHAALFVKHAPKGIWVIDQWKNPKKKTISLRLLPSRGQDQRGNFTNASNNADAFFVIE